MLDFGIVGLAVLAVCMPSASCMYAETAVKEKTQAELQSGYVKSGKTVLVKFYSPGCGHCTAFKDEYAKTARGLEGFFEVLAVQDSAAMSFYGVRSYPSVKLVTYPKKGSFEAIDYSGKRTAADLIDFVSTQLKSIAKKRLNIGQSKTSQSKTQSSTDVVVVTESNYRELIEKDSSSVYFVKVYAPWCGHCKALEPDWKKLAGELKGKIKVAKIDATTERSLAEKLGIQGFPTLLLYPVSGEKRDVAKDFVKYESSRKLDDMKAFALQHYSTYTRPVQLTDEEQFTSLCQRGVCVIVFLPHILDSSEEERKKTLVDYENMAKAAANMPFTFLWSQGGDQYKLEEQLNLMFGYPAVIATNLEKGVYSIHRGDFSKESIKKFLRMQGAPHELPKNRVPVKTVEKPFKISSKDEL